MAARVGTYKVQYEWDPEGAWIITVPEVPGCRTEAATLEEGQRLIRDALSLFVDDADRAVLVNVVVPPPGLTRAVERAKAADREISRGLAKDLRLPRKDAETLLTGARFSGTALEHEIVHARGGRILTTKTSRSGQRIGPGPVLYWPAGVILVGKPKKSGQAASAKAGARRSRSSRGR